MTSPVTFTCDAFLDGRVTLRQPKPGFRSGLDAVFLAAACPAQAGERVLEAGCGAGAASLCLLARVPGVSVTGVEIDSGLAALARENATKNDLAARFTIANADLTASWTELEAAGLFREAYDHVIANPPFFEHGRTRLSKDARNGRARAMAEGGFEDWARFLAAAARPSASATVIHTADALPQILAAFDRRFGALSILPLHPKAGAPAIRVIVSGIKGSRAPASILPGVVLHEADGAPTAAATAILRHGQSLSLRA
ncbi:methyltransferase [Rhodomicrobium vannielii ATCC 17100]|uniref:tRNA1(Val) (adenine(37)-N6)-methyltransferase n=1 Tax=Rhodomicrobium vannielii TaxID=1069 RepID=UPI00191A96AE|nr:methyltransferase [Rhodomicrobium vannielii]MBJ7535505.1 methyltransferase [Rhodomicrobium vannielii ATCC 17100]